MVSTTRCLLSQGSCSFLLVTIEEPRNPEFDTKSTLHDCQSRPHGCRELAGLRPSLCGRPPTITSPPSPRVVPWSPHEEPHRPYFPCACSKFIAFTPVVPVYMHKVVGFHIDTGAVAQSCRPPRTMIATRGAPADDSLPAVEMRGADEPRQPNSKCKTLRLHHHVCDFVVESSARDNLAIWIYCGTAKKRRCSSP